MRCTRYILSALVLCLFFGACDENSPRNEKNPQITSGKGNAVVQPGNDHPGSHREATTGIGGIRVSGPHRHDHLSVYLLLGPDQADTRTWLTLSEALERKVVVVHETGSVNELSIENTGDQAVFIQSGDLVKGGRQDRVLAYDLLVAAHSPRIPLTSYCVEQGRWSGRSGEAVANFNSSNSQVNSVEIKKAIKESLMTGPAFGSGANTSTVATEQVLLNGMQNRSVGGNTQGKVWAEVARCQDKLAACVGASVTDPRSQSSLQLTLENDKVVMAVIEYEKKLLRLAAANPNAIGFAFAVDGKLNHADLYASHDLFVRLWPKLLKSAAAEAVAIAGKEIVPDPEATAVQAWFNDLEKARKDAKTKAIAPGTQLRGAKASDGSAVYESTSDRMPASAEYMHRSYAK